jgi:hypothetical protein
MLALLQSKSASLAFPQSALTTPGTRATEIAVTANNLFISFIFLSLILKINPLKKSGLNQV